MNRQRTRRLVIWGGWLVAVTGIFGYFAVAATARPIEDGPSTPLQARPPDILTDPVELRVSGVRGESVKRLITLSVVAKQEITNVSLVATFLRAADSDDAKDPILMTVDPPTMTLRPDRPTQVLITFHLTGLDHGEYRGKVQWMKGDQLLKETPLTIRVRHGWFWPLVVLFCGVLLGVSISWYRSKGQLRDQAIAGRDDLIALASHSDMPPPFRDAIKSRIADIGQNIQDGNFEPTVDLIAQGKKIAFLWSKTEADWLDLFKYIDTLKSELAGFSPLAKTVDTVASALEAAQRGAPTLDSPDTLRANLKTYRAQVERYRQHLDQLNQFDLKRHESPSQVLFQSQEGYDKLRQRLEAIDPTDLTGFAALDTDIQAAVLNLAELVHQAEEAAKVNSIRDASIAGDHPVSFGKGAEIASKEIPASNPLSPVPDSPVAKRFAATWRWLVSLDLGSRLSKLRLEMFRMFGYLLPVIVFVYTGMVQFYQGKETFGAFDNYIALFLWGFGADASGTKVQDLIRGSSKPTIPAQPITPPTTLKSGATT